MKRLLADQRGVTVVETAIVVIASLTLFVGLIFLVPPVWLRINAVERAATTLGEIVAREPIWTQADLDRLARLGPGLVRSDTIRVTITVAAINRPETGAPQAVVCVGTDFDGTRTRALTEGEKTDADSSFLRTGGTIIIARVEADIDLFGTTPGGGIASARSAVARIVTSRPIGGGIRYVPNSGRADLPRTCAA